MDNKWNVFYAVGYKGGELIDCVNISEEEVINVISDELDFLYDYQGKNLTDQELLVIWDDFLNELLDTPYAGNDGRGGTTIYYIENEQLVRKYPSNECVLKEMRARLKQINNHTKR